MTVQPTTLSLQVKDSISNVFKQNRDLLGAHSASDNPRASSREPSLPRTRPRNQTAVREQGGQLGHGPCLMSRLQDTPHSPWAQAPQPAQSRGSAQLSSELWKDCQCPHRDQGPNHRGSGGWGHSPVVGVEGGAVRRDAGPAGKPDGAAQALSFLILQCFLTAEASASSSLQSWELTAAAHTSCS